MLLTKFIEKNGTEGAFTEGKVYLANDGFSYGAVEKTKIIVKDDKGNEVELVPERNEFQFLDTVFGVWLGPPPVIKGWNTGDTKLITEVEDDSFNVDGRFLNATLFEIIDETNLHPDMFVMDLKSGKWEKIVSVNEKNWISIESAPDVQRPLTDFRFAVEDGAVVCVPIVSCVDDKGASLTYGKSYQVLAVNENKYVLTDDSGTKNEFLMDRFTI